MGIDECLLVNASYALDDAHIVGITGVILSDQVKSLDWRARQADFITALPDDVIEDVLAKLRTLLG